MDTLREFRTADLGEPSDRDIIKSTHVKVIMAICVPRVLSENNKSSNNPSASVKELLITNVRNRQIGLA